MKLTTNDIEWQDGMQYAVVCNITNECLRQLKNLPVQHYFRFYIVERSEMFDHSKPCVKDAEIILNALADEQIKNLGAEAAAKKDFTEHEKSLGLENNYTSEDITPIGDLEQMAVMATLRKMRGEYLESLYDSNWSGADGTHLDLALFHRKAETPEKQAAKKLESDAMELCKLRCKYFGKTFHWKALGESNKEGYRAMIRAGIKLPSNG